MQKATFGAGCFWGVEETFRRLNGVTSTQVGYSGGTLKDPAYEDVCSGQTNHAEVVQIDFDPTLISYQDILKVFWSCHDPTTLNRQGPDVGTQYRSVIFTHSPEQLKEAQDSKPKGPIVTEILPAKTFYPAEEYHQQYLKKRGLGSCHS